MVIVDQKRLGGGSHSTVFEGTPAALVKSTTSITARYLRGS